MGAPVREPDDGKSAKTGPKSEPQSKHSDADLAEVKAVLGRLQRMSRRSLVDGEPIAEDDAAPGGSSLTPPEPLKPVSTKNAPAKDAPKDVGVAPSSCAPEVPDPPWKRKPRREVFKGDIALVELRSQLAQRSERVPEPPVPISTAPMFSGVLRLMSGVVMAAVVVGATGYLWGFRLSIKMPELTSASGQANVLPAPSTPVASLTASNRDFGSPVAARTAPIGLAPAGTRGAANPVTSVDAAHRPASLPTRPQIVSPAIAPRSPVAAEDASAIAAKMKIGVELMTYGEVTAARVMFQRVAEAGEGAGAFALAETYDPLVLEELRLRERIMSDLALARAWYERARDLGSLEARDRISRLAQLPK
jgi:hypothetical protein